LRGTKYLDYLDFQKAFFLYQKISNVSEESEKTSLFNQVFYIKSNINSLRTFSHYTKLSKFYKPEHTLEYNGAIPNSCFIPLNPHYISGFFEGDGSFILQLSGSRKGYLSISLDQNINNKLLLESFKTPLNIQSSLVLNKTTNVLKLSKSGDKYFKEFLIPFFLKYPLHGRKLVQLFGALGAGPRPK
jgi:hypothetical protein